MATNASWLVLLLLASGCGHSAPVAGSDYTSGGPFSGVAPIRLTYSHLADDQASFGENGASIVYRFQRDTPDGDRCLGVLPAGGGTRTTVICSPLLDEAGFADGFGSAALRGDGTIAFTAHRGRIGFFATPSSSGLWVTDAGAASGMRLVMPLNAVPPGASGRWDDLLVSTWLPDGALLAVAATRELIGDCKPGRTACPLDIARYAGFDTLRLGTELARIDVETGVVTSLAQVPGAIAASADHDGSRVVLVVQRSAPDDPWREPLTDTVLSVPMAGGDPVPLTGWPRTDRPASEHLHGVAAGAGRVFVSRSWRPGSWNPGSYSLDLRSDIAEVMPDGSVVPRFDAVGWRWGALAMSPDGRWLLAESVSLVLPTSPRPRTEGDLYLIDLGG